MAGPISTRARACSNKTANSAAQPAAANPAAIAAFSERYSHSGLLPLAPASIPVHSSGGAAPRLTRRSAPGTPLPLQRKLSIGSTSDPLEAEADRVADRVMRMADPAPRLNPLPATPVLRRRCACQDSGSQCQECAEGKEEKLQLKARSSVVPMEAPPIVHQVLRSSGQPLDAAARAFFEPRFGADFSHVRIHTDDRAADSARRVTAQAYTVGAQIAFDSGLYAPRSDGGLRLLAHELAHVVQQTGQSGVATDPLLRRAPRPGHCAGVWSCSGGSACNTPDMAGSSAASTSWKLDVNIDTDVESASDIHSADDIGHTYVVFSESNGKQYSYGFYPTHSQIPDAVWNTIVPGCMVHPDTDHKSCVDYTKTYQLTQEQYNKALQYAQDLCAVPHRYDLYRWNCTTAAVEIAKHAGQSPPSARGKVDYTKEADNPNTLKEGYLDLDRPTRHLTSDSDIRDWVSKHTVADFQKIATAEKARLLNRLLEGWISDDDVTAFEDICKGITGPAERTDLQRATQSHVNDMSGTGQQTRVRQALGRAFIAPPAAAVNIPSPPPPR
ncbi:MAG: DUF4157 domain-containing protein [Terracidiphilus sp.]